MSIDVACGIRGERERERERERVGAALLAPGTRLALHLVWQAQSDMDQGKHIGLVTLIRAMLEYYI